MVTILQILAENNGDAMANLWGRKGGHTAVKLTQSLERAGAGIGFELWAQGAGLEQ
jgi:hypothetical protein